ncbi:galactokinase [Flavobacterium suaedae]|uniref:Galactokinase n=1 Tax=Flavobacterium suaedae TaxID=1767027 RepID=A0ABQ1JLP5_9FLAO|nr:galactokinase [Flavobacterium suaedae]GGB69040.1 galactokinase [Flavobacterium suaedae]
MSKETLIQQTQGFFQERFKTEPQHVFLSPGRINIIGEHVDYNDGFVLPAAIDKYVCLTISSTDDTTCTIVAKDIEEEYTFNLQYSLHPVDQMWVNYLLGVLSQLKDKGFNLKGFNLAFSSTVPMGAGLSSSAALECGVAFAMNEMFSLELTKQDIALIGQKAEHTYVGVKCGIMDQFASVFGKENKVIKLDCNTLEYEYHNADFKDYSLLLLDSNVKHTHLTSGYNTRREEVEKGIAILKSHFPEVKNFRDYTEEQVESVKEELGDTVYRRCLFVVKEIQRVQDAVKAMDASDFKTLGTLMFETHNGLSENYEVSCEELDFLVDTVRNNDAVIGSRMMGGGFGGCTINLVKKGSEDEVIAQVSKAYKEKFTIELTAYKVAVSEGTHTYKK